MKQLIFLSILVATTPLMSSFSSAKCALEVNAEFCVVDGLKDGYSVGDRVELNLNPYPYYELPAEKFISIYGASNVNYDYANRKISFNINQNASLSFSAISSFGGKEISYEDAKTWFAKTSNHVIRLDYKYSFEEPSDQAQHKLVLDLINLPVASHQLTNFTGEFHTSNPTEINETGVPAAKSFGAESKYIGNISSREKSTLGDEIAVYSTNIRQVKNITGVSGCAHWMVPDRVGVNYCDYIYLSYNNAIVWEETEGVTHYSDPINGYVEMRIVCGEEPDTEI